MRVRVRVGGRVRAYPLYKAGVVSKAVPSILDCVVVGATASELQG